MVAKAKGLPGNGYRYAYFNASRYVVYWTTEKAALEAANPGDVITRYAGDGATAGGRRDPQYVRYVRENKAGVKYLSPNRG
jgi:hypothetical protein